MSYFSKKEGNKKKSIIFMLFAYILLFSVTVLGQTNLADNNTIQSKVIESKDVVGYKAENDTTKPNTDFDVSTMNFVLWFMSSKQSPDTTILPVGTTDKKQFLIFGTAPNRLLIRAFLKKAVSYEVTTV